MQDGKAQPRNPRLIVLVVATAVFCSVLNASIVNVVLPVIGRDLAVDPARLGWVITIYLLMYGVCIPIYGRLADRYGTRRLFLVGLGIFAVGSMLCALAPTYLLLLGARLVQGVGGAAIPGLGITIASQAYGPEQRGTVLGVVSAALGVASATGPTLGGWLSTFSWHYIFVPGVVAGLLVPLAHRLVPRGDGQVDEPLDWVGGGLLALVVGGALFTATEGARGGTGSPIVRAALGTTIVALIALVLQQRRAAAPFVPRDLLQNGRYLGLIAVSFLVASANLGVLVGLPLLLANLQNQTPAQVGLALLPSALASAVLGPIAGSVGDRIGGRWPLRIGLLVMLVGALLLSTFASGSMWLLSGLLVVLGAGFAMAYTPLSAVVSLTVPPARLPSALSINSMLFFIGGSWGSAVLTAVLTVRETTPDAINPWHINAGAAYSDAFLLFGIPLALALILSLRLRPAPTSADPLPA